MRIGLIFECGPRGADKKVCEHLASKLRSDAELRSLTLDNKPNLLTECGDAAASLFNDGCERIIIIWDLIPPWKRDEKSCLKKDREQISEALSKTFMNVAQYKVVSPPVYLVCIQRELEAWLLADGRAISTVLSKTNNLVKVNDTKRPEKIAEPKTQLTNIFVTNGYAKYNAFIHAKKIVKALPNLTKIRRCPSFCRFEDIILRKSTSRLLWNILPQASDLG